jgi:hypothetical protein
MVEPLTPIRIAGGALAIRFSHPYRGGGEAEPEPTDRASPPLRGGWVVDHGVRQMP